MQSEYFPAGVEETLLGNTGLALEGSMGNTMYNPGALAFNNSKDDLSFTGVYFNKSSTASFEGKAKSETNISPAFTGAKYYLSDSQSIAFYIYRPVNIVQKFDFNQETIFMQLESKIDFSIFGFTYAKKITNKVGLGLTLEYSTTNTENIFTLYSTQSSSEFLILQNITTNQDAISLKFGAFYKFSPYLNFGFRLNTAGIFLKSNSKLNLHRLDSTNKVTVSSDQADLNSDNPFDLTFGLNYHNANYQILSDIGYVFASKYKNEKAWNINTSEHNVKGNMRYSAGIKTRVYKKISILSGLRFISKRKDSNDGNLPTNPSEMTYSFGFKVPEKNSHFYVGMYYKKLNQVRNVEYFGTIFISVFKI